MWKAVCLVCVLLTGFQFGIAATITVPTDQPNIQAAIAAAVSLDTVLVEPGIYTETIDFSGKSITLQSAAGPSETTIMSPDGEAFVFIISGESGAARLSGFTLTGADVQDGSGILIGGGATPLISDNIIRDNNLAGGMEVVACESGATFLRNVFFNNGGIACIGLRGEAQDARIINNTFGFNARGFFSVADGGTALNNIVCYSSEYGVHGDFDTLDFNDVFDNYPDYQGGAYAGVHDLSLDPEFTNSAAGDLSLLDWSPCINAGYPTAEFNDPDGTRNDIGALPKFFDLPVAQSVNYGGEIADTVAQALSPTICWSYFDTSGQQTAFELQVGTDTDWSLAELWSSGVIAGADICIGYDGLPLADHTLYFLRVRLSDGDGWGSWVTHPLFVKVGQVLVVPDEVGSIQGAINASETNDTVLVQPGSYQERIDFAGKTIKVLSAAGAKATELLSPDQRLFIRISSGEAEGTQLSGFTITGVDGEDQIAMLVGIGAHPDISGNIFRDNNPTAIGDAVLLCGGPSRIHHNVFYNNGSPCILLNPGSVGTYITSNTIVDNYAGILSDISSVFVINNIVASSERYGICGEYREVSYNDVWGNAWDYLPDSLEGQGCISDDPKLVSPAEGDFSLEAWSGLINRGHPDSSYNDPDGTRNDIGAFPFQFSFPAAGNVNFGYELPDTVTGSLTPTIYWTYLDIPRADQQAYQIQAGTDLDWSLAELWDSGPVYSQQTSAVYAGDPLAPATRYYLRIRIKGDGDWGMWIEQPMFTKVSWVIQVPSQYPTIGAAIAAADNSDTIQVASGTYTEAIDFHGKGIVVRSVNGPATTLLTSPTGGKFIDFISGEPRGSALSGFTITGVTTSAYCMRTDNDALVTLENNIFRDNHPTGGPELIWCGSDITLTGNLFVNNQGNACIGIWNGGQGAQLLNNTFVGNKRGYFNTTGAGKAYNNIVVNSLEYGVYGAFAKTGCNDIWNNNPDYDGGAAPAESDISENPWFCHTPTRDYRLQEYSTCAPANNSCGSLIGAYEPGCGTICGDANSDGTPNITDAVYVILYIFAGGPEPLPYAAGDVNCDGTVNVTDAVALIMYIFAGGAEPCDTNGDGQPDC